MGADQEDLNYKAATEPFKIHKTRQKGDPHDKGTVFKDHERARRQDHREPQEAGGGDRQRKAPFDLAKSRHDEAAEQDMRDVATKHVAEK